MQITWNFRWTIHEALGLSQRTVYVQSIRQCANQRGLVVYDPKGREDPICTICNAVCIEDCKGTTFEAKCLSKRTWGCNLWCIWHNTEECWCAISNAVGTRRSQEQCLQCTWVGEGKWSEVEHSTLLCSQVLSFELCHIMWKCAVLRCVV